MPRINFFLVSVHQEQHTNCRSSEHKHPEGYESESIYWSVPIPESRVS